jgi:hypothetical protein
MPALRGETAHHRVPGHSVTYTERFPCLRKVAKTEPRAVVSPTDVLWIPGVVVRPRSPAEARRPECLAAKASPLGFRTSGKPPLVAPADLLRTAFTEAHDGCVARVGNSQNLRGSIHIKKNTGKCTEGHWCGEFGHLSGPRGSRGCQCSQHVPVCARNKVLRLKQHL